jgi:hypothetical protein
VANELQAAIRAILRDRGSLTIDEILERLPEEALGASRNPRSKVYTALSDDDMCERAGRNRYVYLPSAVRGAAVRVPMTHASPTRGRLAVDADVALLLWPRAKSLWEDAACELVLADGPTVSAHKCATLLLGAVFLVELPRPFWEWWAAAEGAGADGLLVRRLDGEASRCRAEPTRRGGPEEAAESSANAGLRAEAARIMKSQETLETFNLARQLIARGCYHSAPAPDSLSRALLRPLSPFYRAGPSGIGYCPELKPALWPLFAGRLAEDQLWAEEVIRENLGLPSPVEREQASRAPAHPGGCPEQTYRLKVSLVREPDVWRVIEIHADQLLDDLHYAIQEAFDWDDDHLYSFYLGGPRRNGVTEVARPHPGARPPMADEVPLGALALEPKERFLYLFDYGDQWEHRIEVQAVLPAASEGDSPRIVERHGEAPPQYLNWDDDGADDDLDD